MYLTKSFAYEIKDVDQTKGVVEIYVNAFGNKDSDGDISQKGAFTKTITENFKRVKHFLNHDSKILLGIPLELTQDDTGLKAVSQMNTDKEIVRDVLSDYKLYKENGRTLEHSIGFNVVKRHPQQKEVITEYALWEYSTLTSWGANMNTPLVGMKSKDSILNSISELVKMYNHQYSDNRLRQIEAELKVLTSLEPEIPTTPNPDDELAILLAIKHCRTKITQN